MKNYHEFDVMEGKNKAGRALKGKSCLDWQDFFPHAVTKLVMVN